MPCIEGANVNLPRIKHILACDAFEMMHNDHNDNGERATLTPIIHVIVVFCRLRRITAAYPADRMENMVRFVTQPTQNWSGYSAMFPCAVRAQKAHCHLRGVVMGQSPLAEADFCVSLFSVACFPYGGALEPFSVPPRGSGFMTIAAIGH